jgi:mannose-6-phosphate isomerase-like protein (cupin superfamily)
MSRPVVVVEPGGGDRVGNVEFLARTVDTPFFNLSEVVLGPGQGVDSHVHQDEDDSWLVLEGTLSVIVGDDARRIEAGPGTFVLVPSGTAHELRNSGSTDVRFLNVHAPGGFDRRIGWRPRRRHGVLATTMALLAAVLLTAGGPASAAGLTKAKVQQIAASVVAREAPTLSVARADRATTAERATTADRATLAGDAERLGGRAPAAYLDRIATAPDGGMTTGIQRTPVPILPPVTITVPDGVGLVRVTGVAGFGSQTDQTGNAILFAVKGSTCGAVQNPSFSYGTTGRTMSSITVDHVVPVTPGTHAFLLCAFTTVESFTMAPTLTVETVAGGAS